MRRLVGIILMVVACVILLVIAGRIMTEATDPGSPTVQSMVQRGNNQVAADMVDQYKIAARSGSAMDKCVHAGLVSAAYLQAKEEGSYRDWKSVQDRDCAAAGVPVN